MINFRTFSQLITVMFSLLSVQLLSATEDFQTDPVNPKNMSHNSSEEALGYLCLGHSSDDEDEATEDSSAPVPNSGWKPSCRKIVQVGMIATIIATPILWMMFAPQIKTAESPIYNTRFSYTSSTVVCTALCPSGLSDPNCVTQIYNQAPVLGGDFVANSTGDCLAHVGGSDAQLIDICWSRDLVKFIFVEVQRSWFSALTASSQNAVRKLLAC